MDFMFEKGAITLDDMDEIKNTPPMTRKKRAEVLIQKVLLGKPMMYDVLLEVLKSVYRYVADKLAATEVNEESSKYWYY